MHVVDALAITGDERRDSLRKAAGSWQTSFDPQISEWGNPAERSSHAEYIGVRKQTRRTDTSQYPEEKKSTETPQVAASERGIAQTEVKQFTSGLWDLDVGPRGIAERHGKAGHSG